MYGKVINRNVKLPVLSRVGLEDWLNDPDTNRLQRSSTVVLPISMKGARMNEYINLRAESKPLHFPDEPSGFVSAMAKRSLAHQMRFSVEVLEEKLKNQGEPRVLQIKIDESSCECQSSWSLYANGSLVAHGSVAFARQCFEQGKWEFRDLCEAAVIASSEALSNDEFRLLCASRAIAAVAV